MEMFEKIVEQRVFAGTRNIWWVCGLVGIQRICRHRRTLDVKENDNHPLAVATGRPYDEVVRKMRLTSRQEIAWAFTVDPSEPDILMEDLTDGWRFAPEFRP
jgi:hypothetical protein